MLQSPNPTPQGHPTRSPQPAVGREPSAEAPLHPVIHFEISCIMCSIKITNICSFFSLGTPWCWGWNLGPNTSSQELRNGAQELHTPTLREELQGQKAVLTAGLASHQLSDPPHGPPLARVRAGTVRARERNKPKSIHSWADAEGRAAPTVCLSPPSPDCTCRLPQRVLCSTSRPH